MTICFVLWSSNYGGAESWTIELATALGARGAGVGVVILGRPGEIAARLKSRGIRVECLSIEPGRNVFLRLAELRRAIHRLRPQVVTVPNSGLLVCALRLAGFEGPLIAIEHGSLLQRKSLPMHLRIIRKLEDRLVGRSLGALVAPSEFMARVLAESRPGIRIEQIYPGVDVNRFVPLTKGPREGIVIGFAGRLIPQKGAETLVRAIVRLPKSRNWILEVAGDGPARPALEALVERLGVGPIVRFRGVVRDMPEFWSLCDIAVIPSDDWIESFGMCAAEAMACGIPAIVAMQGGLKEVVEDSVSGRWFPPKDDESLSELIGAYADSAGLRERHGASARMRCEERFSTNLSAEKFECLIGEVMKASTQVVEHA